jgi:hypothetical protein
MLSWFVACRLAPLISVSCVLLKSIASHLVANNININANANATANANTNVNANKTTTIVGSNLQANTDNGQININAQNLNILSSQDTSNTESNTDSRGFSC